MNDSFLPVNRRRTSDVNILTPGIAAKVMLARSFTMDPEIIPKEMTIWRVAAPRTTMKMRNNAKGEGKTHPKKDGGEEGGLMSQRLLVVGEVAEEKGIIRAKEAKGATIHLERKTIEETTTTTIRGEKA